MRTNMTSPDPSTDPHTDNLPIIPRSTPADEMNACLKNSNLWAHVKTFLLIFF